MTDWQQQAASAKAPVFPILISWDGQRGKWDKRPLTHHGHLDASHDVSRFNWAGANGYGIRMGTGWYTLDLDSYKQGCLAQHWLTHWQVPMETRMHQTVSGGWHLVYRTLGEWVNLRTRQAVVPGLDTRGAGGWIAFGEGYTVARHLWPAVLPDAVCAELSRSDAGRDVKLLPVMPVDAAETLRKLSLALHFGRLSLRHRWAGGNHGLHDTSASGFDMSAAKLLALAGFTHDEIYHLLCTQFVHGVVARDGLTRTTDRQVRRAAARATQRHGIVSRKMLEMFNGR